MIVFLLVAGGPTFSWSFIWLHVLFTFEFHHVFRILSTLLDISSAEHGVILVLMEPDEDISDE